MRRTLLFLLFLLFSLLTSPLAAVTFYVDFGGYSHPTANRGGPLSLAAFQGTSADRDEILAGIREDLAPFAGVITTTQPPARLTRGWMRIVIGGSVADLNGAGGRATWRCPVAMAPDCEVNVGWVAEFSGNQRIDNHRLASTAAHELGHMLGSMARQEPHATLATYLSHYIATGPLGNPAHNLVPLKKGQIMGGTPSERSIWWSHPAVAKGYQVGTDPNDPANWLYFEQDDILSIASVLGMVRPDHGSSPAQGTGLTASSLPGYVVEGSGIVEMNSASWPGMCPPVPRWQSCPYIDENGDEIPPGADPAGQGVVFAQVTDYFRFDVTANASNGAVPRLEVRVRTVNGSQPARRIANLDAEVVVWFNDPVTGWTEITSLGSRRDGPFDLYAQWVLGFDSSWRKLGEYAVGVRSAGEYGDLGRYTVEVSAHSGVEIEPVDTGGPRATGRLRLNERYEDIIALLDELIRLVEPTDLHERMGELIAHGLSKNGVARFLAGEEVAVSKSLSRAIADALAQAGPARVVASLLDWSAMEEDEAENLWLDLQERLRHLEGKLAPRPKQSYGELELTALEEDGEEHECTTVAEVEESW